MNFLKTILCASSLIALPMFAMEQDPAHQHQIQRVADHQMIIKTKILGIKNDMPHTVTLVIGKPGKQSLYMSLHADRNAGFMMLNEALMQRIDKLCFFLGGKNEVQKFGAPIQVNNQELYIDFGYGFHVFVVDQGKIYVADIDGFRNVNDISEVQNLTTLGTEAGCYLHINHDGSITLYNEPDQKKPEQKKSDQYNLFGYAKNKINSRCFEHLTEEVLTQPEWDNFLGNYKNEFVEHLLAKDAQNAHKTLIKASVVIRK